MANTKLLLLCGVIGSPLFVVVFSILSVIRPGYDPWRQNVSSLEIGELGWVQIANFIVTGLLFCAFAIGLRRALSPTGARWQPLLIGLVGVGLIGAGVFVPDRHPLLHDICSAPVFFGLIAACLAFAWLFFEHSTGAWATYSLLTAVGVLTAFVLSALGFGQHPLFVDFAGLWQRVSIITGWSWIMLLAIGALRSRFELPAQVGTR